jgi:hypothetical protein
MACAQCHRVAIRNEWRQRVAASSSSPIIRQKHELDARGRWMVARGFVSELERSVLLRKALEHMQRGELEPNPCGPGRYFAKADDAPSVYVDALLDSLTRRCERCLRLSGMRRDGVLGRTISLILPGGFIHRHNDAYHAGMPGHTSGFHHLRCNIAVSLAHPSGRPVIEDEPLPVAEGDLWVFFASRSMHQTEPLCGDQPRIVFGFGWAVPPDHALALPPASAWRDSDSHSSHTPSVSW